MLDSKYKVIEKYSLAFWKEIKDRISYTDLFQVLHLLVKLLHRVFFSVWGRITSGREFLTVGRTVELIRVAMEGSNASTLESFNLSKRAIESGTVYN